MEQQLTLSLRYNSVLARHGEVVFAAEETCLQFFQIVGRTAAALLM